MIEHDACGVGLLYKRTSSHSVIADALTALAAVEHRGACGADGLSGDGAGLLTAIPWRILSEEGFSVDDIVAVGSIFLPVDDEAHRECRAETERHLQEEGLQVIGWRVVPVDPRVLGQDARTTLPRIEQVIVGINKSIDEFELERRLMIVRKRLLNFLWRKPENADFYISSLSGRTIVYKSMTTGSGLRDFYHDLRDPRFASKFAVFHRRFSTNTMPRWRLAQPFRLLAHNGEINTLAGNRKGLLSRSKVVESAGMDSWDWPLVHPGGSDSANLDNLLEFMVCAGLSPEEGLMRLVPEACGEQAVLDDADIAAFYEYHAALQEPWDGPALLVYSDGRTAGALLDKNGLRPARYTILTDGTLYVCSETGALPLPPHLVATKGRLGAGEMLTIYLDTGEIKLNDEIRRSVATTHPYSEWLSEERIVLPPAASRTTPLPHADVNQLISPPRSHRNPVSVVQPLAPSGAQLEATMISVGIGSEELELIKATARDGKEPVFSMGDDTALAVLSSKPRVLYDYFKQRFAQVTNPPIDHMRERAVMSLATYLGPKVHSVLPSRGGARLIKCGSPILDDEQLQFLKEQEPDFTVSTISVVCRRSAKALNYDEQLQRICHETTEAIRQGANIVILSDRGIDANHVAVPALAVVGALHNHLIHRGLRTSCSLVVDTAACWNPHQFACLLGYGAEAVSPYLMWQLVSDHSAYRRAIEDSILKILSKMGISTLTSYIGGQLFEALGLARDVIDKCFQGTPSQLHGMTLEELAEEQIYFHNLGFPEKATGSDCAHEDITRTTQATSKLPNHGLLKNRAEGEFHANNPEVVSTLHRALGLRDETISTELKAKAFADYSQLVTRRAPSAVRDLLQTTSDRQSIPIEEVESASEIARRFCTGGMSLGALSKEAHEVLAIAMNRLGGKSNSGEGGEDPARYRSERASAIRQIASARFGVTAEYIATAKQLEIKMAQGAKPGEGGQLPAHKVSEYIGLLRRAKPGITLISPPPHHDIYSIEDLAQLIFDLKQVNPQAAISVKLVSSSGIGTIAAGVAKANADIIQISGHDGGTGAAPISSIKNAGMPWEIGLAEAHQTLLASRLRDRVILRADGGLRTGHDVIVAALLGAEEYGFGTIALVAAGCIMARVCHTNNCPVGITSQKEQLRAKFTAIPDQIVEFFLFIAEEIRHELAMLGYRSLSEIIGRTDLLKPRTETKLSKVKNIDLTPLLHPFVTGVALRERDPEPHSNGAVLDNRIIADETVSVALANQMRASKSFQIKNTDRGVGARLAGRIAEVYGDDHFTGSIDLSFHGSAGQSFGAFLVKGITLRLDGESNDYVGKGMSGGEILIRPDSESRAYVSYASEVIIGNACLYGATGGALFAAGSAGERFAVRNSGATAVIEGAGAHCCEYMTGGTVVVLGKIGTNFGAGMSGGRAFVLDLDGCFPSHINPDNEKLLGRISPDDERELLQLVRRHHAETGSPVAEHLLADWNVAVTKFLRISFAETNSAEQIVHADLDAAHS